MQHILIEVIFYVFAAIALVSALMVITQNNPVRCVLFLVVTFFSSAVLWILAEAEFLALILILVYVGAVMTLFLFVVMMLDIDIESMKSHFIKSLPLGLILVALLTGLLISAIPKDDFKHNLEQKVTTERSTTSHPLEINSSNTEALGMVLYTDYFLAFELAAVLLLIAIVSAITLAHRNTRSSKRQDVKKQIMVESTSRVELVSMKAEK
ncbi:MAG: NADH:ubiquinone oxidoreductase subunit J [Legionella sp. 40-6]|nr:NADH-quinone oxidoreductase subunit J [Legionella sp.]OJY49516.1 MAG: NADH:ubiquinone oxidoreductase subunit J [Legionella sp. 40-6]